jgi:hypothetical protein
MFAHPKEGICPWFDTAMYITVSNGTQELILQKDLNRLEQCMEKHMGYGIQSI